MKNKNGTKEQMIDVVGQKCYKAFQAMESPCPFCTNKYIFGKNEGQSEERYCMLIENIQDGVFII